MSRAIRIGITMAAVAAMALVSAGNAEAQTNPYAATNNGEWGELPAGRTWGATSAVYPAADGNIWVAERCGENSCAGKEDVDPILLYDKEGKLLKSFGAGLFLWPHGMHVDPDGNPVGHRRSGRRQQRSPGSQVQPGR